MSIKCDIEGYLLNLEDWNKDVAIAIAKSEGIELTSEHWRVIELLRDFYQEYKIAPAMRALVSAVKRDLGSDKGNSIFLHKLFPGGPAKQANKIAGLPKPIRCI